MPIDPCITLKIHIPESEGWNESQERFVYIQDTTITLEHSLVSVAKWEARHKKPFLDRKPKTDDEMLDYIKCMTIEPDIPDNSYAGLTAEDIKQINAYINDPMTGTTFYNWKPNKTRRNIEIETAEVIYWEMIQCEIPIEWEHRHFNQLRTLIQVCMLKNQKNDAMPASEIRKMNHELNAARRAKYHSKG